MSVLKQSRCEENLEAPSFRRAIRERRAMSRAKSLYPITPDKFDAVLFDLDGVLTATATALAICWKKMFDEYLQNRASRTGEPFQPFEITADYRLYVEGNPRCDGVRYFLRSRGIELPEGTPVDSPQTETVCGLENHKNEMINAVIEANGVEAYEGSIALVRRIRTEGIQVAVVTSSRNCDAVLKAAGIGKLFKVKVDGNLIHSEKLSGKPAPEAFLAAAKILGVDPKRAVVVEDAISGVQAGRDGGFGLVIGVARKGDSEELRKHGADLVVKDLGELLS
jgi:beta-phosphoglucomutase family hydrolase